MTDEQKYEALQNWLDAAEELVGLGYDADELVHELEDRLGV